MNEMLRRALVYGGPPLFLYSSIYTAGAAGVTINLTASAPIGIWGRAADQELRTGALVSVCPLPGHTLQTPHWLAKCDHGYKPVIKTIVALEGSVVQLARDAVHVDGRRLPRSARLDSVQDYISTVPTGSYKLESGQAWLFSDYSPRSLDSRYYGPIDLSQIRHVVRPILVTHAPDTRQTE